jgi:hypothetical protein
MNSTMNIATLIKLPVTWVWLSLIALSGLTWLISANALPSLVSTRGLSVAILSIAFVKVRIVIMHFMEVVNAPAPLRIAMEVWVLVVLAIALILYWLG